MIRFNRNTSPRCCGTARSRASRGSPASVPRKQDRPVGVTLRPWIVHRSRKTVSAPWREKEVPGLLAPYVPPIRSRYPEARPGPFAMQWNCCLTHAELFENQPLRASKKRQGPPCYQLWPTSVGRLRRAGLVCLYSYAAASGVKVNSVGVLRCMSEGRRDRESWWYPVRWDNTAFPCQRLRYR
jgi:hypothetical protein